MVLLLCAIARRVWVGCLGCVPRVLALLLRRPIYVPIYLVMSFFVVRRDLFCRYWYFFRSRPKGMDRFDIDIIVYLVCFPDIAPICTALSRTRMDMDRFDTCY